MGLSMIAKIDIGEKMKYNELVKRNLNFTGKKKPKVLK